jgi:hypothetical protein
VQRYHPVSTGEGAKRTLGDPQQLWEAQIDNATKAVQQAEKRLSDFRQREAEMSKRIFPQCLEEMQAAESKPSPLDAKLMVLAVTAQAVLYYHYHSYAATVEHFRRFVTWVSSRVYKLFFRDKLDVPKSMIAKDGIMDRVLPEALAMFVRMLALALAPVLVMWVIFSVTLMLLPLLVAWLVVHQVVFQLWIGSFLVDSAMDPSVLENPRSPAGAVLLFSELLRLAGQDPPFTGVLALSLLAFVIAFLVVFFPWLTLFGKMIPHAKVDVIRHPKRE